MVVRVEWEDEFLAAPPGEELQNLTNVLRRVLHGKGLWGGYIVTG